MAGNYYGGQNRPQGFRGPGGGGQNRQGYGAPRPEPPKKIEALPLPVEFVDLAEEVIRQGNWSRGITTSKIRRLFSLLTEIYNAETLRTDAALEEESIGRLRLARVRMLYEAGRDKSVKAFLESAKLIEYLKDIGDSRKKLISYFHYMEALVAYHKFYGGREG